MSAHDNWVLGAIRPPIEIDTSYWTFSRTVSVESWRNDPAWAVDFVRRYVTPPEGSEYVGSHKVGISVPDRNGFRQKCSVDDDECDYVLVTLVYTVPNKPTRLDRASDTMLG